jgi:hypothetical protein
MSNIKLFESKKVRSAWIEQDQKWYFSIIDVIEILTDSTVDTSTLLRIIQSIPSPKAEPFKKWLAKVGYERMQEIADPAQGLDRARENWQKLNECNSSGMDRSLCTKTQTGQRIENPQPARPYDRRRIDFYCPCRTFY